MLLEKQEDLLYEEHDKFVETQKSLALEIKRNEMLSSELSSCHETIAKLKSFNDDYVTNTGDTSVYHYCCHLYQRLN